MLSLTAAWSAWILRRVETVTYETANSVRRRVSVDFRLRDDLFGAPVFSWGTRGIHYVPLGHLKKHRLTSFDARDETGRALPVMSRRKNAAVAAATLIALAQSLTARQLGGPWAGTPANRLVVPADLEAAFWRLAYLNSTGRGGEDDADAVYRDLLGQPQAQIDPVPAWQWSVGPSGLLQANVSDDMWRWALISDGQFARFASDVKNSFFVCVPIDYVPDSRRIVKFSYVEHLEEPDIKAFTRVKGGAARFGLAGLWNRIEDWVEGIPQLKPERDEWVPELDRKDDAQPSASVVRRLARGTGWSAKVVTFSVPSVSHAASYHFDFQAPSGIQVRRAQLLLTRPDGSSDPLPAARGARNLERAHVYTGDTVPGQTGKVLLHLRPESAFIIRTAAIAAALTAAALTSTYLLAHQIATAKTNHAEAASAVLVVVPGLLSAYSARGEEHPLATSMVAGLRLLAIFPSVLAIVGAGFLLLGKADSVGSLVVWIAAWVTAFILLVGWRLAARGRPHPSVLET